MIVEMLQPSSLPWTRLEVATLAGFHNISTQPTFGKSLKLSYNFKSKMSRGARAPSVGSIAMPAARFNIYTATASSAKVIDIVAMIMDLIFLN